MSQSQSVEFSSEMDGVWVNISAARVSIEDEAESMPDCVRRVGSDWKDLLKFYSISISKRRHQRLAQFYPDELGSLFQVPFEDLSQQDKVDFLLLRNFLRREQRQLHLDEKAQKATQFLLPFAPQIVAVSMQGDKTAGALDEIKRNIQQTQDATKAGKLHTSKITAYKAAQILNELRGQLQEFLRFYSSYDPMFDWWATKPWQEADAAIVQYLSVVKTKRAGMRSDGDDEIVGEPVGRDGLVVELEAEMIPYTPEELIKLAEEKYKWCQEEMIAASKELGFGED
ncbi:hypothetical protein QQZ08_001207 [Neonectria magnoliae]|uniref:Uncharacterized protein n=1 Tax=Neonectria magnoliae TaxID=2732573 RepID=A0ABR1IGX8_9HYPO